MFLGDRISECVMCVTGVDLAYRTYFRILSELLLSTAVDVSTILSLLSFYSLSVLCLHRIMTMRSLCRCNTSHLIISHHITSHHISSHLIISHLIISHHIISYHITSYHITSYLIISYHISYYSHYRNPRSVSNNSSL